MGLPVARPVPERRKRVRRRRLSLVRLGSAFVLLVSSGGFYGLTAAAEFAVDPAQVRVEGLRLTDPAAASAALGLPPQTRPNLMRLSTASMEQALERLPAVLDADVEAVLPDRLVVRVREREPILVWSTAVGAFLLDVDGRVIAPANGPQALPRVEDRRPHAEPPSAHSVVPAADLTAFRLLAALTPEALHSRAAGLELVVDATDGFQLVADGGRWRAIFGHYTPTLRPTAQIPLQVQCLRSLLAAGEAQVRTVYLSPAEDRCGTYLPAGVEPRSPAPGRSPGPSPTAPP